MNTSAANKLTILLAEDDPDDSLLFMQAIEQLQIPSEIHLSADGLKLVKKLSERISPDLIFLDMNMPFKNGLECLSIIRSKEHLKNTPVIIYSTSQNTKEIKACFDSGANYYVVKPFSFDAIVRMISEFCHRNWQLPQTVSLNNFVVAFE
jgi:CheY-like chemotaxis protein